MKTDIISISDCDFLLLAKMPDGRVLQVIIDKDYIKSAIRDSGNFQVLDTPLGIDFYTIKSIDELD
jgi:hypothetical protein